jgi:hypothetical protein
MKPRFLVSLAAAAIVVFAGTEALGSAIAPAQLKIIATVVAHPHAVSTSVAHS